MKKGDQVKPSREGLRRVFKGAQKPRTIGTIVAESRFHDCYVVKWAGVQTRETLHKDFIEPNA